MNGLHVQQAVAVKVGQLMETSHNTFGQTSGRLTKECLQNINLMIANQLFLKQSSDPYIIVTTELLGRNVFIARDRTINTLRHIEAL